MKVKICGITRIDDAVDAIEAGADLLGFNFYKPSPRSISIDNATEICDILRDELGENCPALVGVFVNMAMGDISIISEKVGLDFAQLSADETDRMLLELRGIGFKSIRPMTLDMALDDVQYFSETMPRDERAPSAVGVL